MSTKANGTDGASSQMELAPCVVNTRANNKFAAMEASRSVRVGSIPINRKFEAVKVKPSRAGFYCCRVSPDGQVTPVSGRCGSIGIAMDMADDMNSKRDAFELDEDYAYEARKVSQ